MADPWTRGLRLKPAEEREMAARLVVEQWMEQQRVKDAEEQRAREKANADAHMKAGVPCYFGAVCKVVLGAVQAEADAGEPLSAALCLQAFQTWLLWLSLAIGSDDYRTPLRPGRLADLQQQLVRLAKVRPGLEAGKFLSNEVLGADPAALEAFMDKLRSCTRLGQGSDNVVYEVERGVSVLRVARQRGGGGSRALSQVVKDFTPTLIHHMRAAVKGVGAPVLAFVPVVNGRVAPLDGDTLSQLLLGGGTYGQGGCGVAIGMVLGYRRPLDDVVQIIMTDKAGMWPRAGQGALSHAVLRLALQLKESQLNHTDFKVDNLALSAEAVDALIRLMTEAQTESAAMVNAVTALALDADDMMQLYATVPAYITSLATIRNCKYPIGHALFQPPRVMQMEGLEVQSYKAALVAETLVLSVLAEDKMVVLLPQLWTVVRERVGWPLLRKASSTARGDFARPLPIYDPAHCVAGELAQLLAALRHPLADQRWELTEERLGRMCSVVAATASRAIGLPGPQPGGAAPPPHAQGQAQGKPAAPGSQAQGTVPAAGGGAAASKNRPVVCLSPLSRTDLVRLAHATCDDVCLQTAYEKLFEAAHYSWPAAGPDRDHLLRLLEVAVRSDVVRTAQLKSNDCERQLMMCEMSHLYHGRSMLHLLMASGNTEAVRKLLHTLCDAGALGDCQELLAYIYPLSPQNGDTAAMLAAVHGRRETLQALVDFVQQRLSDPEHAGDPRWLRWLGATSDMGGILAAICRLYNDHNQVLSNRLSYRLPTMQLTPPADDASSAAAAGAGVAGGGGGSSGQDKLLEVVLGRLRQLPKLAAVPGSGGGSAGAAPGSSGSGSQQQSPSPASGPAQSKGSWTGLLLDLVGLPKKAQWRQEANMKKFAENMLLAKTSKALGGNTAFHLYGAMAGDMGAVYDKVVELYGQELGRKCMLEKNENGQTPVEVLLQCHGLMCSEPGFRALGEGPPGEFEDTRGIRGAAERLRAFLAKLPAELQCRQLQDRLGEAAERLL